MIVISRDTNDDRETFEHLCDFLAARGISCYYLKIRFLFFLSLDKLQKLFYIYVMFVAERFEGERKKKRN